MWIDPIWWVTQTLVPKQSNGGSTSARFKRPPQELWQQRKERFDWSGLEDSGCCVEPRLYHQRAVLHSIPGRVIQRGQPSQFRPAIPDVWCSGIRFHHLGRGPAAESIRVEGTVLRTAPSTIAG